MLSVRAASAGVHILPAVTQRRIATAPIYAGTCKGSTADSGGTVRVWFVYVR